MKKTVEVIKGDIVEARRLGELTCTKNGYLAMEDGVILGVYDAFPERFSHAHITDYTGKLILQAFCDMHLHAPQYAMLGMGMDLPLLEWLSAYAFKTEARFQDEAYARRVYGKLARELVNNGTTRVCAFSSLHLGATLILMEEFERAGITGFVGKVNMDRDSGECEETTEESKRATLSWLDACDRFHGVRPILTPRFTPSCSDELMSFLGQVKRERGLYVQSHLSENTGEIALVKRLHPDCDQYWQTYDKFGLFDDHTVLAHCVYSDEREQRAMIERNVYAVHCADSNINICSGFAPVREFLSCGGNVLLGSDIAGGAQISMLDVMSASIRASKARTINSAGREAFLTVAEAYYLATSAGAMYFGDEAGFAQGNKLHAIVVDESRFPESARELHVFERFERAAYLARDTDIVAVYGDGKRVK